VAPTVGPDLPAGAAVRAALTAAVDRLVAHDAGMRLGDPEALHQARVALRTLRSHLRTFSTLIDRRWSTGVVAELRAMADAIGPVRDLDVLVERLAADAQDLHPMIDPLFDELAARRERARANMLERLRDERYASLLERLVAAAAAPRLVKAAARPAAEALPPIGREGWRRLRARARGVADRAGEAATADLHRARIAAKRARYAAEAIAPALAPEARTAAEGSARALARLQDALGAVQDAFVAREEILAAAARRADEGPFNLAAGTLLERQARAATAAREAVGPAWERAAHRRRRRWTRG
jgi:CHAD domain-containing protein